MAIQRRGCQNESPGTDQFPEDAPPPLLMHQPLTRLATHLVNQSAARIIVPAQAQASGFWFGGGNMVVGPDGALYLAGRYRNAGDSRLGTAAGERGLELAIFRSDDCGGTFSKFLSFSKSDLDVPGRPVLSIEGCALQVGTNGVELFVSTEKDGVGYPAEFRQYLKPGTGVWSIDVLRAESLDQLAMASVRPLLECTDPRYLHIKDPFFYSTSQYDYLMFCSHPFSWTSSNTGYVRRDRSSLDFGSPNFDFFPRGTTWDVAMSRGTAIVDLPRVGAFANETVSLLFYDGGECVRNLAEHQQAVTRPRGYSCEELGGAAFFCDGKIHNASRLSQCEPLFVSPHGTGCSRYVDVLTTPENWYVTWQQAQSDGSQPLVLHVVPTSKVYELLG